MRLSFLNILLMTILMSLLSAQTTKLTNPLMPMTFCLESPHRDQVDLLDSLGYDGLYYASSSHGQVPEVLDSLQAHNMGMMGVYVQANAGNIATVLTDIEGTTTQLSLYFPSNTYTNDTDVLTDLNTAAQLAKDKNIQVAIYPHNGFYIETLEKAVNIIEQSNMDNIGVMFNLNHAIRVQDKYGNHFNTTIMPVVQANMKHIISMTLVGSDSNGDGGMSSGQDFKKILGTGNYNTLEFVEQVIDWGYTGPFTIQCFGVEGDKNSNLQHNIDVWISWKDSLSISTAIHRSGLTPTSKVLFEKNQLRYLAKTKIEIIDLNGKILFRHQGQQGSSIKLNSDLVQSINQGIAKIKID